MRLPVQIISLLLCATLLSATLLSQLGCTPSRPVYLGQTNDLNYYLDKATEVSYPDVETAALPEATETQRPISVLNPDEVEFQDLTLEDVISIALQNSKVIRGYGTPGLQNNVVAPGLDTLTSNPAGAGTFYNVAVVESEPGFFPQLGQPAQAGTVASNTSLETQQGVEAALAEFDAMYAGSVNFDQSDRPRNTVPVRGNIAFDRILFQQDSLNITHQISKKSATGTQLFFRSVTDYLRNNIPQDVQPLPSVWTQAFEAEIRQPLLRGRGALVNRMPVIVARIQSDQELANLETQLQNMICNVEIRYWDLQCAYRIFETNQQAMMVATNELRFFESIKEDRALRFEYLRAVEQYHFYKSQVERSFSELVDAENDLRWLMGWGSTDGTLIRTEDTPLTGYVDFDWSNLVGEALSRRPELRLTRWEVKKKEMLLAYARNSLLPQLNATALYRWLGSGDYLWGTERNGVPFPLTGSRAMEELTGGNYQELSLGLEMNTSLGFRREMANVRNAQLKLARELARLEDAELDTSRELTMTIRAIDANFQLAQSHLQRYAAANDEVEFFLDLEKNENALDANGRDRFVDALRRRADAQTSYHRAICEYNKALALLHRRKGSIMEYNNVAFGEGPWPSKAYYDAEENARRRSASWELDYGWTRPNVISRGDEGEGGEVVLPESYDYSDDPFRGFEEIEPGETLPLPLTPGEQPLPSAPGPTETTILEGMELNGAQSGNAAPKSPKTAAAGNRRTSPAASPAAAQTKSQPGTTRVDQQVQPIGYEKLAPTVSREPTGQSPATVPSRAPAPGTSSSSSRTSGSSSGTTGSSLSDLLSGGSGDSKTSGSKTEATLRRVSDNKD